MVPRKKRELERTSKIQRGKKDRREFLTGHAAAYDSNIVQSLSKAENKSNIMNFLCSVWGAISYFF